MSHADSPAGYPLPPLGQNPSTARAGDDAGIVRQCPKDPAGAGGGIYVQLAGYGRHAGAQRQDGVGLHAGGLGVH